MARFYAGEIASIIPAADGASSALQGMLGVGLEGLAGGIGFGVAFESLKFVAVMLQSVGETAKKAFSDADQVVGKTLDDWNRKAEAMKRTLAVAIGGEGAGIRMDLSVSLKKVNDEIAKAKASLDTMMFPWQRTDLQKQLDELVAKRREIVAAASTVYATEKKVTRGEGQAVRLARSGVERPEGYRPPGTGRDARRPDARRGEASPGLPDPTGDVARTNWPEGSADSRMGRASRPT